MIDIEKVNNKFLKYVDSFDLSNDNIRRKKYHSIRVQNISKKIAESLNLDAEKINIALAVGILHDIGRFEQEKQFHTFDDLKSFDHGDYGAELLKDKIRNFIDENKYDNIILNAIKYHNKLKLSENLTEDEILFSNIVRDADKLDIIDETINLFYIGKENLINESKISDYTFNFIKKCEPVKNSKDFKIENLDKIIKTLAFTFDLNFKVSFELLNKENYINRIIQRFQYKDADTKLRINEVQRIVNKYIDEKINTMS